MTKRDGPRLEQTRLMALCRIKGVSWNLIAREGMRPGGLGRLLKAEFTERNAEAEAGRTHLKKNLPRLDDLCGEVERLSEPAWKAGAKLTTVLDEDYPLNLRAIFNAPPFLFYKGTLDQARDARSVAVVGTRSATPEGLARAWSMARLLAEAGVTVVSGMAKGIDTVAHEATIAVGGRTVAVIGTGILRVYPPENKGLSARIEGSGAVVSQFWPNAGPAVYTFPQRNVTMSGFGQGTVVIEASATSGAKMQARMALEHGKNVFLLDTLINNHSWATKYVERGAIRVGGVEEILGKLLTADRIRGRTEQAVQLSLGL